MRGAGARYADVASAAEAHDPELTDPRLVSVLHALALACSAWSVMTGILVLAGWAFDVEWMKRFAPGLTATNPVTAVAFVGMGIAVALTTAKPHAPSWRTSAVTLALVVAAVAAARLLTLAGVVDAGVDSLLFRHKLAEADFGRTNQMAPNTAVDFLLVAAALLMMDRSFRRFRWTGQILAAAAAMSAVVALMGYAYGLRSFYGFGSHAAMALPTALGFLVLSVGLLCARPRDGIMAVVASKTTGGTMFRRLLPAVILVPAVLGAMRLAGRRASMMEMAVGLWLIAVTIMTVFAVLVAWNALLLYRMDVSRAASERQLTLQANHDSLTYLPNRRLFLRALAAELGREDGEREAAVLFIDLDMFKVINDSLGHVVGDQMLIAAGRRIRDCVAPEDVVARLGGDEFTVLLTALTDRRSAVTVADRICAAFGLPFTLDVHEVFTSVSIGIAFAERGIAAQDVLRNADIAMYQAKARGRSRYEVFEGTMAQAARNRQQLEHDLRRALVNGELRVYYQPEVEIETGRLVGMEALVRWEHPSRGLMAPADFLPVAEESGLIVPIGGWVLLEACRQAREWQTQFGQHVNLVVSVNLSGKHLQQATLIDEVHEVLETTGLDPRHLIIEITETVAMAGAETTIGVLRKLKGLGVQLAIDDFGTGFSSLAYLKRFPVDILKIDKSFVDGVDSIEHDTAIVRAIIALGHALNLRIIAEGVERPEQLARLRSLGSELGQGYFFGRPLSNRVGSGMPSLLEAHGRWQQDSSDTRPA